MIATNRRAGAEILCAFTLLALMLPKAINIMKSPNMTAYDFVIIIICVVFPLLLSFSLGFAFWCGGMLCESSQPKVEVATPVVINADSTNTLSTKNRIIVIVTSKGK